jgi:hypothetical protein
MSFKKSYMILIGLLSHFDPIVSTISPPLPSPVRVYNSTLCSNTYVLNYILYEKNLIPTDRKSDRSQRAAGDQRQPAMVIKLIYSHYY